MSRDDPRRRRRTRPTAREQIVARVCDALVRLLDFMPLVPEERGDIEEHVGTLGETEIKLVALHLEAACDWLADSPARRGWSWRVWGRRRHYFDHAGRTLCGKPWDGGLLMEGRDGDPESCRSCAAILARERSSTRC